MGIFPGVAMDVRDSVCCGLCVCVDFGPPLGSFAVPCWSRVRKICDVWSPPRCLPYGSPRRVALLRYHRSVHLCSMWPRARVKSLTRTLSGCGSFDFPHSSPLNSARRTTGASFASPDDGPDQTNATESNGHHRAGTTDSLPAGGAADAADNLDGGATAGLHGTDNTDASSRLASQTDATPRDAGGEGGAWGQTTGTGLGTPPLSALRGGEGGGGGRRAFWSGSARSPGVLVSAGLQLSGDGGDEARASGPRRRSSLGSGSLASVISDSPSEVGGCR